MTKISKEKDQDQVKAFRKAAREFGCDDNEERFQDALRAVAKQKPKPTSPRIDRPGRKTMKLPERA
ncbi:MAG: hypothetical protein ABSD08_16605 [Xanthobacteraceae bacterium]|jgi:redox-regulated HSP33 family molecular chaperone